jgi:hypothetical protein
MRGIGRILALVAMVCGGAAIYNVSSDQAPLETAARRTACATRPTNAASICRLQLKQLTRSPFKQAYVYIAPGSGRTVAVDCVRRWVLFGDYACTIAQNGD